MSADENLKRPTLTPLPDGPFIYENPLSPDSGHILDSEGNEITPCEGVALCRCGGSSNKPFCDGTHVKIGFSGERLSDRHNDRRRSYAGEKITIHDNRHICAHPHFCVNGLPAVFRYGQKPWIDPGAAPPGEIIEVVERCPSGALSYSVDGVEHRDLDREPSITVSKDGPYYLVGGIEVVGEEPRAEEVSREHCACCRCGHSSNKPFCDGTHRTIGFKA
ncbi:MAG: CDGSH iron-sulfur domain-containing protein [Candidatus Geothermincolia bacterium]